MQNLLNVAQIIISVVLTVLVILQARGGLGGIFGGGGAVYRTRRGMEKTLFQLTIILAIVFLIISMLSVKLATWS